MKYTGAILLLLSYSFSLAQTCGIVADKEACKGELTSFSATASTGATSYSWGFSDGSSANTQNINKAFSTAGYHFIELTVGFNGGGSCIAKDTIYVHSLPVPKFTFIGSIYCHSMHELCIQDSSTMDANSTGYAQRIILWGDGGNNTNSSPAFGDQICYSSYSRPDTFQVVLEITSDEGCESVFQEDIIILPEHNPSFEPKPGSAGCNYQTVCFSNDSAPPADLKRFLWNFGNGAVDSTNFNRPCIDVAESKKHSATLSVTLDNGCMLTGAEDYTTAFQDVIPDARILDSILCYGDSIICENAPVFFADYYWYLIHSDGDTVDVDFDLVGILVPPEPGSYKILGRIKLGKCDTTSPAISVEVYGVKTDFKILNRSLCTALDTAYFINTSVVHPATNPNYLWNFGDSLSPASSWLCSTAVSNCNFDTSASVSRHMYEVKSCYNPRLYSYESDYGCIDSTMDTVSRVTTDAIEFKPGGLPCFGKQEVFIIGFGNNLCLADVYLNPDTLCYGPDVWIKSEGITPLWSYSRVCDSSGWIFPGFIVVQGDSLRYRSADSSDYYVDYSQICIDTLFYDSMYRLTRHPGPFVLELDTCLPLGAEWVYRGNFDSSITLIKVSWGDSPGLTEIKQYRDTWPAINHTYTQEGVYPLQLWVEDTLGCYFEVGFLDLPLILNIGYHNSFTVDSVVCPGQEFKATDSIRYWFDPFKYWRDTLFTEQIYWDFGDGMGIVRDTALPTYVYPDKGDYTISMITIDRNGCRDTFHQIIQVGGVHAVIAQGQTEYLCDQIVQLFDSSWSNLKGTEDTVKFHYWDFGDGTNISELKNPFHYYENNGYYTVTHIVRNIKGCTDTTRVQILVKGPEPYFDIISDTVGCAPFEVGISLSGINISEFVLYLGDQNLSTISAQSDTIVYFTYSQAGVYDIVLSGSDSFYNSTSGNYYTCTEWFPDSTQIPRLVRRIVVLPTPPAEFDFDEPICPGAPVELRSNSDTIYRNFSWQVDTLLMEDAGNPVLISFEDTGTYQVSLFPSFNADSPYYIACFDTVQKFLRVSHVKADFAFVQDNNCAGYAFSDSSVNAISFEWNFGHPISGSDNWSAERNPRHTYAPDTGLFSVCLLVSNSDGCRDSICKELISAYTVYAELYNVFTPGSDASNDVFLPKIEGSDKYKIQIYNRWGEMVFSSSNPLFGWDGTDQKSGAELPGGTYFYILEYRFECTGEEEKVYGAVELIRK